MSNQINIVEAVAALDAINATDAETAHEDADRIILNLLGRLGAEEAVRAYDRLVDRAPWWACA